jgi:hypothetical protein
MTNGGERNALKGSREKLTQPELTSNRQKNTLESEQFYSLGSPADGLKFPTWQRGSYFQSLGHTYPVSTGSLCVTYGMNHGKKV